MKLFGKFCFNIADSGVSYHDRIYTASKVQYQLSDGSPTSEYDSFYDGCDAVKTCFGLPQGCIGQQNCAVVTTVSVQGNKFIFGMQAKRAAYVATGLSDDLRMVKLFVKFSMPNACALLTAKIGEGGAGLWQ